MWRTHSFLFACTDPQAHALLQVTLTAASDTSDLLGSYEQAEPSRSREAAEQRLVVDARAVGAAAAAIGAFDAAASVAHSWRAYAAVATAVCSGTAARDASLHAACAATTAAAEIVNSMVASAWSASMAACFDLLSSGAAVPATGSFEWVDGILLRAMASGDWVLLDNANLCSPTVLDRLNPLLEPAGELLVPEAGLIGGVPRIAAPAPGFRLLLALDPGHGEVSRAMRNRGIEVFMLQADDLCPTVRSGSRRPPRMCIASIRVLADTTPSGVRVSTWVRGQTLRTATLIGGARQVCARPRQPVQRAVRIRSSLGCCVYPTQAHFALSFMY